MTEENPDKLLDITLQVFARKWVEQMRYINYPKEWSEEPLLDLVPLLVDLLNFHSQKLGDTVLEAYKLTFPEFKHGNLNQLRDSLFKESEQYYLDEYIASNAGWDTDSPRIHNEELAKLLVKLAGEIMQTFAKLSVRDENKHRTLERIAYSLTPVMRCVDGAASIAFDFSEFIDTWRNLPDEDRTAMVEKVVAW